MTKFDSVTATVSIIILFFSLSALVSTFILGSQSPEYKQNLLRQNVSPRGAVSNSSQQPRGIRSNSSSFSSDSNGSGGRPAEKIPCCQQFMHCFSLTENLSKLGRPRAKKGDQELESLNGIRVFCTCFIILGNSYYYMLKGPIQNLEVIEEWV